MGSHDQRTRSPGQRRRYPRRAVLRGAGIAGVAWSGATLLACSGNSTTRPTSPTTRTAGRTSTQAPAGTPRPGGTYTWYVNANPPVLDPHRTSAVTTMTTVSPVMSRLLRFKSRADVEAGYNRETEPDLASSVESPDALTWTVKLRPGVTFHNVAPVNGHALEAEDVKASFTRALDAKNPNRGSLTFIDPTQIQTPANDTVVFKLAFPYAPFPKLVASGVYGWIFPREALAGTYDPAKTLIGSGPFLFDSYTPDVALTYKKNPAWFETGRPYLDGARRAVVPDAAQQLAQFTAGNLDEVSVARENVASMRQQNPKAQQIAIRDQGGPLIYFQLGDPASPWQDIRLRQAVSLAIDRDAFAKVYAIDRWQPSFNVPLNMGKWAVTLKDLPADTAQWYKLDLPRAKQLLAAAGAGTMSLKLLMPTPHPRDPYFKAAAETIRGMLSALPWQVNLVYIDYNKDWVGGGKGVRYGNFPGDSIVMTGIEGRTDVDEYLYGWWHSKSTSTISHVADSTLDGLIDRARGLLNEDQRVQAALDAQKYLAAKLYAAAGTPSGFDYTFVQSRVANYTTGDSYGVGTGTWAQLWLQG